MEKIGSSGEEKGDERLHKGSESEESKEVTYRSSFENADVVFRHGELLWCIYDPETGKYSFKKELESGSEIIRPTPILKELITKTLPGLKIPHAFLPSEPIDYGNEEDLTKELWEYLYYYIDYPGDFRKLDTWYARLTWIYDKFPVIFYRRALSPRYGEGKSRWCTVLGAVCYKAFVQGAVATPASVFRLSDEIQGTQLIDENNFSLRTEVGQAIMLILNSGYSMATGVVTRIDEGAGGKRKARQFITFSPKLIATRQKFPDDATESRTITHSAHRTDRDDIPVLLGKDWLDWSLKLRNKLLSWRIHHIKEPIRLDSEFKKLKVEPRLKEILLPLASITSDGNVKTWLREFAIQANNEILEGRKETIEAYLLRAIFELMKERKHLSMGNIAEKLGSELEFSPSARKVGTWVSNRLGLRKKRIYDKEADTNPYTLIIDKPNIERLRELARVYGLTDEFNKAITSITSITIPEGTTKAASITSVTSITYPKGISGKTPTLTKAKEYVIEVIDVIVRWLDEVTYHGKGEIPSIHVKQKLIELCGGNKEKAKKLARYLQQNKIIYYNPQRKTIKLLKPNFKAHPNS